MGEEVRAALAFLIAGSATLALTQPAIALAHRTGFFDHPVGYKGHSAPTPYLGGVAVVAGLLLAAALLGNGGSHVLVIGAGALAIHVLGTVDDRRGLGPGLRICVQAATAGALFAAGVRWDVFGSGALDLALTIVFVLGVVNAYNLMDNLDGAAATVAGTSGIALGTLAAVQGDPALAALAFAVAGACAGFLRFNLTSPARIFLGDGGSMPLGLVVAGIIMAMPAAGGLGWVMIPLAVVLVGLPALDTALVIVSRLRRGAGVLTGARDHLTHRLLNRLGTPRKVAMALAAGQAVLCGSAAVLFESGRTAALIGSAALIVLGVLAMKVLESPRWAPAGGEEAG